MSKSRKARRAAAATRATPSQGEVTKPRGTPPPTLSRRKRLIFTALVVALPFALLLATEGVLRLFGLGGYAPVLHAVGRAGDTRLIEIDPAGTGSYFSSRTRHGAAGWHNFLAPKPPGTVRVFFVGASLIKGFPQPAGLASSAFAEAMLQDVWPDRQVEVINLGTTAVASFPVLGMLHEALAYEPDLIVICTGHNEFFGAFGVASVHSAGRSPGALRLRRRVGALALMQALAALGTDDAAEQPEGLMQTIMGQSYVAPDDDLRTAAADNLRAHISAMIAACRERGVAAVVCTLPSNERDLAPIGKDDLSGLDERTQKAVEVTLAESRRHLATDPAAAVGMLEPTLAVCDAGAAAHFVLGRAYFGRADYERAAGHFRRALDLDSMPWRAPSPSNEAVRVAAALPGALLCDVQAVFRAASPGGCIGWELMDDHVHPSLRGQWLLARAIVETLTRADGNMHVSPEACAALPGFEAYAARLGDNPYDRWGVAQRMRAVFGTPFMRTANPEAYERFVRLGQELEAPLSPSIRETLHEWLTPMWQRPYSFPITGLVAPLVAAEGNVAEAGRLFELAERSVAAYSGRACEFAYYTLDCRRRVQGGLGEDDRGVAAAALARGQFLAACAGVQAAGVERWVGGLHVLCGEYRAALPHLQAARADATGADRAAIDGLLIEAFMGLGQRDEAQALAEAGLRGDPANAAQYEAYLRWILGR